MDLSQIKIGETFKNYKALCTALGIEAKSAGRAKQLQLADIQRYMKIQKADHGHTLTVLEVYDIPVGKQAQRISFAVDVAKLLLAYCSLINGQTVQFSKKGFLVWSRLVNDEFYRYAARPDALFGLDSCLTTFHVRNFYERSQKKFSSIIEAGLDHLKRQGIIDWQHCYLIYKGGCNGTNNRLVIGKDTYMSLVAPILREYGMHSLQEAFFKHKIGAIIEQLNEHYGWVRHHKVWRVKLLTPLPTADEDINDVRKRVAWNIIEYLNREAEHLYAKNHDDRSTEFRYYNNFVAAQRLLSELLICPDKDYHSHKLMGVAGADDVVEAMYEWEQECEEIFG